MQDLSVVTSVKNLQGRTMRADTERKHLTNSFFTKNPLKELSAATLMHFSITAGISDKLEQIINNGVAPEIEASRKEKIQQERQLIMQTDDPAALVEIMRKGHDIFNQRMLCDKIISLHKQTMPFVLKRYRTCALDHFIDSAAVTFALGEKKYAKMLREMYGDIRCPYARACACLVFGIQGMEEEIPFLLSEYQYFKQAYSDESFDQHPLLALYLLHGKF